MIKKKQKNLTKENNFNPPKELFCTIPPFRCGRSCLEHVAAVGEEHRWAMHCNMCGEEMSKWAIEYIFAIEFSLKGKFIPGDLKTPCSVFTIDLTNKIYQD